MAPSGPQRPREHLIGEVAERAFEDALAPTWVSNKLPRDYGWDYMVTLTREGAVSPLNFFAQVKGSESVQYLSNRTHLSLSLEVSTLQLLVRQQLPALLAVCDVSAQEKPVYWVWVPNAIDEVEQANPGWASQETLTIRVPLANRLAPTTHQRIELEVQSLYDTYTIGIELLRMVTPGAALPRLPRRDPTASTDLRNTVLSSVARTGLGELISTEGGAELEVFSEVDRGVWELLNEVKILVNAFRDTLAREKLASLADKIEGSAASLQARYWNARGILAIRSDDQSAAVEAFARALSLGPAVRKYATNLLAAEFNAAWDPTTQRRTPPDDWDARLAAVLAEDPDHVAIRLYALRLVKTHGGTAATEYIRNSDLWTKDRKAALVLCAELCRISGDVDEGLRCLSEVGEPELRLEPELSLTMAELLFRRAISAPNGREIDRTIHGYGPADVDVAALRGSAEAFLSAYRVLRDHEFPRSGEEIVRGTAMVLMLLGRTEESEEVCRAYLERHPTAHEIRGALAMALAYQGDLGDSIPHARAAVAGSPTSAQAYINLLVVLQLAEDYKGLLEECRMRQMAGFVNDEERRVSHEFAAIAYTQRGEFDLANRQISELASLPEAESRAVVARGLLLKAQGVPKDERLRHLREGLAAHPESMLTLTALVHELMPPTAESAEEVATLLEQVRRFRQLAPEEMAAHGRALLLSDRVREAVHVFERAYRRYPTDARFLFDLAHALRKFGDPDGAYAAMSEYLKVGRRDPDVYRVLGYLARDTDRLDEAIEMFMTALGRSSTDEERGEIHRQLWELRRRRGDSPKAVLEHAIGYGRTTGGAADAEARFLMLCLLSPGSQEVTGDEEVTRWCEEIRERMAAFGREHPRFSGFQTIRIPEGLTEEQQRRYVFAEMAYLSLPGHLRRSQFELLVRGDAWPLVTRNMFLRGGKSIFEYWEMCQESDEYAHSLHMYEGHVGIDDEGWVVPLRGEVCVDLSALLTLSTLELLDELLGVFSAVFVPRGTLRVIQEEFGGVDPPHPEARKLLAWLRANRRAVHVQAADGVGDRDGPDKMYRQTGRVWVREDPNLAGLVGGGTGESVLLAQQLGLALYCDEATVRRWAREDYGVNGFSTLGLLTALRRTGRVTARSEARCLVRLITRNYRKIPLTVGHLHGRLLEVLAEQGSDVAPTADTLDADEILGPLLRQLGSRDLSDGGVYQVAAMWWVELLSSDIPDETVRSLVRRMSFTLSQRSDRPDAVLAGIWAAFILKAGDVSSRLAERAWSVVDSCTGELMPQNEPRARRLLQERLPDELYRLIQLMPGWDQLKKDQAMISLGGVLPPIAYQRLLGLIAQSARRGG